LIVSWSTYVNTKILRSTTWEETDGFIQDKTRSGKQKRRGAFSQEKRPFNVRMRMSESEYQYFHSWYVNTTKKGVYSFYFPVIDAENKTTYKTYRFAEGGAPKYSNPSGIMIDVSMEWEEV